MSYNKTEEQNNMSEIDKSNKSVKTDRFDKSVDELNKVKKQAEEYLNGWQRAKADYQNLQKDMAKEREAFSKIAKISWVMQILPLYNNLQTAFDHLPKDLEENDWIKGILHIKDQFSGLLKDLQVEKIKTKKQKFDAKFHEAVVRENNIGVESEMIIREVSPGYTLDNEVIVPAKVVVAE